MNATAEKVKRVFECHNSSCSLGSRKDPGRFTDGITAEQINVLTGEPVELITEEGRFGEGYCPNCGEPGIPEEPDEEAGLTGYHDFGATGTDPYQDIHDEIDSSIRAEVAAVAADPNDDSVTDENKQEVLKATLSNAQPLVEAAIAEREGTQVDALLVDDEEDA